MMVRSRFCWPAPQVAEHSPHSDHWATRQDCMPRLQGCALQVAVSFKVPWQGSPPRSAGCCTRRSLKVWPPPQVWSQRCHSAQGDISQSTSGISEVSSLQPSVSMRLWSQALPAPSTEFAMPRRRMRCCPSKQELHSDHGPTVQFTAVGPPQGRRSHGSISDSLVTQAAPPSRAFRRIVRRRVRWPPPHFLVQGVHSSHEETRQSTGARISSLQAAVSVSSPEQSRPPFFAGTETSRRRSLWNVA
mmetsp:Transcript_15566/g.32984  ORF Transcript_15566/g.32984 Transcript_15566/m.32984 type:complete len:245 (+) Transcript_15566:3759-4493(+)